MTGTRYDDSTRAILRSAGMTDEDIRQLELKADRALKAVLNQPAQVSENTISRKWEEDDLAPLGSR